MISLAWRLQLRKSRSLILSSWVVNAAMSLWLLRHERTLCLPTMQKSQEVPRGNLQSYMGMQTGVHDYSPGTKV